MELGEADAKGWPARVGLTVEWNIEEMVRMDCLCSSLRAERVASCTVSRAARIEVTRTTRIRTSFIDAAANRRKRLRMEGRKFGMRRIFKDLYLSEMVERRL